MLFININKGDYIMKIISWNVNGIKSTYKSGNLEEVLKKKIQIFYVFKKLKLKKFQILMVILFLVILHLKLQIFMEQPFIQR